MHTSSHNIDQSTSLQQPVLKILRRNIVQSENNWCSFDQWTQHYSWGTLSNKDKSHPCIIDSKIWIRHSNKYCPAQVIPFILRYAFPIVEYEPPRVMKTVSACSHCQKIILVHFHADFSCSPCHDFADALIVTTRSRPGRGCRYGQVGLRWSWPEVTSLKRHDGQRREPFSTWGSDGECLKWHDGLPQWVLQHSGQQWSCPEGMSSKR